MFHNRRAHPDIKKTTHRFIDPKKESHSRLRALRTLLDYFDSSDSKIFFNSHYSEIFYVFHDVFSMVEANLRTKGHKSQREDLDSVLFILEKILLYLPELVHKRWQFHSLGRIMRKLLHHGNALKLRREGARLFMLWFQLLQDNADEFCQLVYACLIPGFPNPVEKIDWSKSKLSKASAAEICSSISVTGSIDQFSSFSNVSLSSERESEDWCLQDDIGPIFPANPNERIPVPESLTKFFLDRVLDCMSTQLVLVEWTDTKKREYAFYFLFENFKKFYLPYIFQDWNPSKLLYKTTPVAQVPRSKSKASNTELDTRMNSARESVLRWFVAFTVRFRRSDSTSESSNVNQSVVSISSTEGSEPPSPGATSDHNRFSPGRNKEYLQDASEVIRKVLYATKSNIRLLHEVLRQGFLLPPKHLSTIRQVLLVYHEWLRNPERPVFMQEPDQDAFSSLDVVDTNNYSPQSPIRSLSYSYAVDKEREKVFRLPHEDVRAGLQANLRFFILHSAAVFLVEDDTLHLDKQVDVCKRVIHLYRSVVLEVPMEPSTWEQMLQAILEASRHLLVPEMSHNKAGSLAKQVAGSLLQTLFVTWIRANLKVNVPISLWDKCLEVMSSSTHWQEVISEWSVTMETLTRVMARTVYGLDMADLPLERLTEQKRKRRPHIQQERGQFNKASFSRWSRMDKPSIPKQVTLAGDKITENEKSDTPVFQQAQKPLVLARQEGVQLQSSTSLKEEPQVPSNTSFVSFSTSSSSDHVASFRSVASSPTVSAGSVTVKESETAGQLSKDAVRKDSKESSHEEQRVTFSMASDTDSLDSLDTQSKTDQDTEVHASEESDKPVDATDAGLFSQRLHRLSSSDSYLSSQDNVKSWYGSSLDFDVSSCSKYPSSESPKLLDKINESSLESKLEELHLGHVNHRTMNRTSTPSHEVRLEQGEVGNVEPLSPVKEEFNHDTEGRSSPESSGGETPDDLEAGSRSPSPEAHLEESREELLDDGFADEDPQEEDTSVVAGGYREGWGPVAAVVLWRRVLGILGNVNKIKDPAIHAKVLKCLTSIWNMLAKIRLNQGISLDNKSTPPIPVLLPPLQHMATWVFEAASLSINNEFKSGRLLAYKLMCAMTVCRQDLPLTQEYLTHFYRLMHIGLTGTDQDIISAIVSSCAHFFSMMLPSSSLLILDFIQATNGILLSQNMELPREEAVTLIGSLLCFPNNVPNMPLHQPGHQTNEYQHKSTGKDIKDKLVGSLLRSSKLDPSCSARCTALNALGVFIVEELIHCQGHPRVHDCICVLLASITFHNRSVCHVACDVIRLLSEYYKELCVFDKDLPLKIVEVLCHAVVNLLPGGESSHIQEQNKVLASVLMCLLDWLMVIPVSKLLSKTNEDENVSVLARVFQVLKMAASNKGPKKRTKQLNISTIISGDGRPIRLGRLQEGDRMSSVVSGSPVETQPDSGEDGNITGPVGRDTFDFPPRSDSVELTARAVLMHMVNHMGHYPLGAGPSRVDSLISEHEDNPDVEADELSSSIFNAPNVQFFLLNDSVLISLVELSLEDSPDSVVNQVPASTAATQCRVITRDMTGKNVWDYTLLHGVLSTEKDNYQHSGTKADLIDGILNQEHASHTEVENASSHPLVKLKKNSSPVSEDRLDDLLCNIGASSQECLLYPDHSLNEPGPSPENLLSDMECDVIDSVLEQNTSETKRVENDLTDPSLSSLASSPPPYEVPQSPFQLCRFVVSQTGMMTWEKRTKIDLLKKTERFLRELKNLDNRRCRETHKIALVYVAQGQEDKTSIMSNCVGSEEYERFIAGLAWEVDLSKHTGFLGGLEKNLSTGTTAPYYCTSTTEVMFHVSTRMPLPSDNTEFNRKVRHIGNDEVHIVWSEHYRDYRHGIVNTDFAHVMIIIYPLKNQLFRIQIIKKPKVPMFGPLFDGALVDRKVLPALVRATAINASRASRELLPVYERYYEERAAYIERIVKNHKDPTTYEDFASLVFCPVPKPPGSEPPTPVLSGGERHQILRAQTAARASLSDSEKTSIRHRSKSAVTSPRVLSNKLVVEEDMSPLTSSLPDGLDNMAGSHSTTDGTNPRQDKKRLSLRWRNKLAGQNAAATADSD